MWVKHHEYRVPSLALRQGPSFPWEAHNLPQHLMEMRVRGALLPVDREGNGDQNGDRDRDGRGGAGGGVDDEAFFLQGGPENWGRGVTPGSGGNGSGSGRSAPEQPTPAMIPFSSDANATPSWCSMQLDGSSGSGGIGRDASGKDVQSVHGGGAAGACRLRVPIPPEASGGVTAMTPADSYSFYYNAFGVDIPAAGVPASRRWGSWVDRDVPCGRLKAAPRLGCDPMGVTRRSAPISPIRMIQIYGTSGMERSS